MALKLEFPRQMRQLTDWNRMLLQSLAESGEFDISYTELPHTSSTRRFRKNFHFMRLDGVMIGVDTWDFALPTTSGDPILNYADLLLKIEYRPYSIWEGVEQRHQARVSAWTMFGYECFPTESFQWNARNRHKHLCVFSGHQKRSKRRWLKFMRAQNWPVYGKQSVADYMELICNMRWGVILQGRAGEHCDGKNRREHAYTSLGMPLALNYQPHYPFPMNAGEHYVYLKDPEDLLSLQDIDPAPYAEASRQLWVDHFSPIGMARTLKALIVQTRSKCMARLNR